MELLLRQLESSLKSENYFLSLFVALSIPDIAGALGSNDGIAGGEKYKAWFERWVRPRHAEWINSISKIKLDIDNPLDGESCYLFRCSLLHQGRTIHPKSKYERILFIEPNSSPGILHYNVINNALNIDLVRFCKEVISGTRMWLAAESKSANYINNHENFVKRHEGGCAPYIGGVTVIS